ncbi:hypothetical protein [Mycobacteroides abscessus]
MKFTLEPMRITRDHETFMAWWHMARDRVDMIEALDDLADSIGARGFVEHALQRLMIEVFQESGPVNWLIVHGLRSGAEVRELALDADPSYDTDGDLEGVNVVLTGAAEAAEDVWPGCLRVSVHVDKASAVAPESFDDLSGALAELVDTFLELVNDRMAEQDHFINTVRAVSAATESVG